MWAYWENGGRRVSDPLYQEIFCEIYNQTPDRLGFVGDETPPLRLPELGDRLRVSSVDSSTVELLEAQTHLYRQLDRQLGTARLLPQTEGHVAQLEDILRYSLPGPRRPGVAMALAEAAALAGWQALDLGDVDRAWRLHEIAKAGAREGENPAVLAHVTAQQANVLLDVGREEEALELIQYAHKHDESRLPALLRTWLLAAESEARAAMGDELGARQVMDRAADLLPDDAIDPELPFLWLAPAHLVRWRGSNLARLGMPEAVEDLSRALGAAGESIRAETGLRADLAIAFAAQGDMTQARVHANRAAELASKGGSARQRARLANLLRS
ncbi:hypothetical protein D5S17_14525 [Pseudonocardiaceae bacterium YIM PH 21723]|nr:hypothetical protein D5S17_14525 [Pseudonocardiaceae bacterium YIM PH 21723]